MVDAERRDHVAHCGGVVCRWLCGVDEPREEAHTVCLLYVWVDVLGDAYPEGCARAVGIGRLRRLFAVPRRAPQPPTF